MSSEVSSAVGSPEPAKSFEELLETGLATYASFHRSVTSPEVINQVVGPTSATLRALPSPHPAIPIRVLASLAHNAREGGFGIRDTGPGPLRDFGDWFEVNKDRLTDLTLETFGTPLVWASWAPPETSSSGGVVIDWNELVELASLFHTGSTPGVTSVAFVFVRDWAFRFIELWPSHHLDDVLDALSSRIGAHDDPPLTPELSEIQSTEREVLAESGGEVSTVWSVAIAMSLRKGPLVPYGFVDERVPESLRGLAPAQSRPGPSDFGGEEEPAPEVDGEPARPEPQAAAGEPRAESAEPRAVAGYRPSTAITSDLATSTDALRYELYADAIAEFIADTRTRAPLTIGIKAPWGAGKSSLMKMIRLKLDPESDEPKPVSDEERLSNKKVLKESKKPPEEAGDELAPERPEQQGRRTTVWFNAWKYQSSDQVWAGLAHAIISQVEQRMTVAQREKFWASLNIQRFDVREVRRRIYAAFFERIAAYAVALPILIVALIFAAARDSVPTAGGALAVAVAIAVDVARRWHTFAQESAAASNPQLVRDPGYEGRMGFLHLVHEDLERVLRLVASRERPLVVFIDDLDRCSYTTVAQVIEALNTFLAGDFEHCMFVIAMEPELVAAQIHVAYRDLFEQIGKRTGRGADDLGWRFLEKMVQLPLALPPPHEAQVEEFVGSLMGVAVVQAVADLPDDDERMVQATRLIEAKRANDPSLSGVAQALEQAQVEIAGSSDPAAIDEAIVQRAARRVYAREFDDRRPEIRALVLRHAADLDRNPREIKRFLNLLRFYAYVAFWRQSAGIAAPDLDGIAKLAILSVRYPQLLTGLGADNVLAALEGAAAKGTKKEWDAALKRLPDPFRTELQGAPGLVTIIRRNPRVAETAAGFL